MVTPINCPIPVAGRRRTFWTTRACRTDELCGDLCEDRYGLELYCPDGDQCQENDEDRLPGMRRSIKTDDWVRSLALNILLTFGRRESKGCGYRPGTRGGHWSDSYRPDDYPGTAGSNWTLLNAHGSVSDAIAELKTILKHDMQKMVTYGVANSVDVEVTYIGNNTAKVVIKIYGVAGDTVLVGAQLQRVRNSWAWST